MPELTATQAAVEDAYGLLLEDPHKLGREDGERYDEEKFEAFGRLIGYLFPDETWRTTPHVNDLLTELGFNYGQ